MKYFMCAFLLIFIPTIALGAAGTTVTYEVGGQSYEGYFISPNEQAPFLFLIHDWDGLTDYEVKRADMLADLGYAVFAADLFGAGVRPTELNDKRQHTGELYKDRAKMRALMKGALNTAEEKGADIENGVAFGYCFGGAAVLELARSGENMKGFATFHGGLKTPVGQNYINAQGKMLIMHGSADTAITMDQFAALTNELETAGVPHEMISYGGAQHAFTVFGGTRYQELADKKSWQHFLGFLADTLKN